MSGEPTLTEVRLSYEEAMLLDALGYSEGPMAARSLIRKGLLDSATGRLTARGEELRAALLTGQVQTPYRPAAAMQEAQPIETMQEATFRAALAETRGNVVRACRRLNIGRATAYRWMFRFGIKAADYRT